MPAGNKLVQLLAPYSNPESQNAQRHRQTDGRQDYANGRLYSAHSVNSSTQRSTLPSRPSIRSFTCQGLETSSWSSSRALDRPTPQRHRICSCQPLETDSPSYVFLISYEMSREISTLIYSCKPNQTQQDSSLSERGIVC